MSKKIVFMGTPIFAVPILRSLYESEYTIPVVYTKPAKKSHRGQKIVKSAIQNFCDSMNIKLRTPQKLKNNKLEYEFLKKINADLAVVVAYGQIIPKEYLKLTKKGFLNIHASILPKWRGAAPIQRSIMNLDNETGLSIMKINEILDSGPVCNVYKMNIDKKTNAKELSDKLSLLAAGKILENVDEVLAGKSRFIDQDHLKATYAKKIEKKEGQIDWSEKAEKIIGKINGLSPFPGAFFVYEGQRYKVHKAEIGNLSGKFGEVISKKLEIACGNNQSIKILEIQKEGKKPQSINEFILGSKIEKGSVISYE